MLNPVSSEHDHMLRPIHKNFWEKNELICDDKVILSNISFLQDSTVNSPSAAPWKQPYEMSCGNVPI